MVGPDKGGRGHDQAEHGDESQVGGTGEGPHENGDVEAGDKHVEHGDEGADPEEIHNSDTDGLFHFDILLRRRRSVFCVICRASCAGHYLIRRYEKGGSKTPDFLLFAKVSAS